MGYTRGFLHTLVTGAVGVAIALGGTVGTASAEEQESASVRVTVEQTASNLDGVVAYRITALNQGDGFASDTTITVPFNASLLRPLDTQVSRREVWVSAVRDGAIDIKTGRLDSDGGSAEAVVRFVQLNDRFDAALTEPLAYRWSDRDDGGEGRSNYPSGNPRQALAEERGLSAGAVGGEITFSGNVFEAGEPVFLWFTNAQGQTTATRVKDGYLMDARMAEDDDDDDEDDDGSEYLVADSRGAFSVPMRTAGLPAGTYTMVARGHESGLTSTTTFQVR